MILEEPVECLQELRLARESALEAISNRIYEEEMRGTDVSELQDLLDQITLL